MLIIPEDILRILRSLDKDTRKLIGGKIRSFQNDESINMRKLKSVHNTWRITAGDWRIILESRPGEKERIYEISEIIKRKDAYK